MHLHVHPIISTSLRRMSYTPLLHDTTCAYIYDSLANEWGRILRRCPIYRLCPMLNGTIKQDAGFGDSAFGSIAAYPSQMNAASLGLST